MYGRFERKSSVAQDLQSNGAWWVEFFGSGSELWDIPGSVPQDEDGQWGRLRAKSSIQAGINVAGSSSAGNYKVVHVLNNAEQGCTYDVNLTNDEFIFGNDLVIIDATNGNMYTDGNVNYETREELTSDLGMKVAWLRQALVRRPFGKLRTGVPATAKRIRQRPRNDIKRHICPVNGYNNFTIFLTTRVCFANIPSAFVQECSFVPQRMPLMKVEGILF